MDYPLQEQIGDPNLFVGRVKEFQNFGQWIAKIPKRLSKSRVILARRKSGKTAFVQRIFNQLWNEQGAVIPFFFDLGENEIWLPDLSKKYYRMCTAITPANAHWMTAFPVVIIPCRSRKSRRCW